MKVDVISPNDLFRSLPVEMAIDALEDTFGVSPLPEAPPRAHLDVGSGDLLLMPSWSQNAVGVKLVTVNQSNPAAGRALINGVYVLFSQETLEPLAIFDAAALTGLRTAAVSGLATRHLARRDATTLVIFGAGAQARHHLPAMLAVRPIEQVVCVTRTRAGAEEFVAGVKGVRASVGTPDDVAAADVICTCTTSPTPVFEGRKLPDGVHVNAVGAYKPTTRELDDDAITRAKIVVETRDSALAEAGDLLIPLERGVITRDAVVADLSEVVAGAVPGLDHDVTIFKSVGVAFEDLVIAAAAYERL
ncbi:MAG: ornithine cyclodeaminase family protein [Actinomycetota bacterium]